MVVETTVCVVLLCGLFACTLGETHSLSYLYTVQSKSSPDRGYGFSVVTLLDDEQIDSYSSISTDTDGTRTPKQGWLRKMRESEWKDGTDKMTYDGYWLKTVLNIQMKAFGHEESDGHTLQWRTGCEGGERSDGSVSVMNYINEYGYDGDDFISYNWTLKKWTPSVSQAKKMEEKWNGGKGQNPDQKRDECVTWLKIYLQYKPPDIRLSPPGVHVFVKKPETNSTKLNLTCLATGFYPKDVVVRLRKFNTSLPEHLLTSSGVRPNEDGTYQLRKSVEIQEDHTADYDCYVNHSSLETPVITKWGGESIYGQIVVVTVGVTVVVVAILAAVVGVIYICRRKRTSGGECRNCQCGGVTVRVTIGVTVMMVAMLTAVAVFISIHTSGGESSYWRSGGVTGGVIVVVTVGVTVVLVAILAAVCVIIYICRRKRTSAPPQPSPPQRRSNYYAPPQRRSNYYAPPQRRSIYSAPPQRTPPQPWPNYDGSINSVPPLLRVYLRCASPTHASPTLPSL